MGRHICAWRLTYINTAAFLAIYSYPGCSVAFFENANACNCTDDELQDRKSNHANEKRLRAVLQKMGSYRVVIHDSFSGQ